MADNYKGGFGGTKNSRCSVGVVYDERVGDSVAWFSKLFLLLKVRNLRGAKRVTAFVQYMEVTAPLDIVQETSGRFYLGCSTSDKTGHSVYQKERKRDCVHVRE